MVEEKKEIWPTVAAIGGVGVAGGLVYFYFKGKGKRYCCECVDCDYRIKESKDSCDEIECPKCGGAMRKCEPVTPPPGVAEFRELEASYYKEG